MNSTNAKTRDHTVTRIEYGSGAEAKTHADTVAKLFPGAQLVQLDTTGVNVVLGSDYAATAAKSGTSASSKPSPSATDLSKQARSADADPCSKLSYG